MTRLLHPGCHLLEHPLASLKMTTLRDRATPPVIFRRVLQELAQLLAYEALRDFAVRPVEVQTPLAPCMGAAPVRPLVLVPILRAGLAMADGILKIFPDAAVGHIGMFRNEDTLEPVSYYFRLPPGAGGSHVLLLDPMLATGHSLAASAAKLKAAGVHQITAACIVGCPQGISHLRQTHPDMPIFLAACDATLNGKGYILPGLGDAGDRIFGT